jgi:hypothetical protein
MIDRLRSRLASRLWMRWKVETKKSRPCLWPSEQQKMLDSQSMNGRPTKIPKDLDAVFLQELHPIELMTYDGSGKN